MVVPKAILVNIEQLMNAGDFDGAKHATHKSKLNEATKYAVLGTISLKENDHQQAEVLLSRSLEMDPSNGVAIGNYAQLLVMQKKFKVAISYAEKAHLAVPKNESYALNYASCLSETDQCKKAIEVLQPFLNDKSPKKTILLAISSLLRADLRPLEAADLLKKYENQFKEDADYLKGVAETYSEIEPQLASQYFNEVIKQLPDSLQLKWNWSFVELRLQNFKKGWEIYDSGLSDKIGRIGRPLPPQVKLLPVHTSLEGLDKDKWTLFVCEQGIGDQVLFLGCFNEVLKKYPKSILIGEDRMMPLLRRSFPNIGVYTYGFVNSLAKQNHRINGLFPIGSMQKYYRASKEDYIQNKGVYLSPNLSLVEAYKKSLKEKLGDKKLIGISWRGGFWDRQVRTKSFDFELFNTFMKNQKVHFISLQYGDVSAEHKLAKESGLPVTFIEGIDFKKDIDAWVALGYACDEIISVSTALVHFMGAMGKPVNLLLSEKQSPFIWGLEAGPSIAYPQVNIFRKKIDQTAEQYFEEVSKRIVK